MANEELKQLGYAQVGETFRDEPGITESQTIKLFRKSTGEEILVLHKYGPESADRYFQEVQLTALQADGEDA
jgi:hypothetical protein